MPRRSRSGQTSGSSHSDPDPEPETQQPPSPPPPSVQPPHPQPAAIREDSDTPPNIPPPPHLAPVMMRIADLLRQSENCSKSLVTDQDGVGPYVHTSGQSSYVGRRVQMRKDDTVVNPRAEQIVNAHDVLAAQGLSQMSTTPGGSSVQSTRRLLVVESDEIYRVVAPKKKNRNFGDGSIDDVPATSSSGPRSTPVTNDETIRLRQEFAEARSEIATMQTNDAQRRNKLQSITELLKFVAMDSLHLEEDLCNSQTTASPVHITPAEAHPATVELGRDLGIDGIDDLDDM
ncbi:unnamed protein product [Cochlearia groenlandica]